MWTSPLSSQCPKNTHVHFNNLRFGNRSRFRRLVCLFFGVSVQSLAREVFGDVIGDGRTSDSSSQEFFSSLDVNADGTVEEHEMIGFVTGFGGKSLDEPDEIRRSAAHAFKRLDTNHDGALTVAESNQFGRQLGKMLSVTEVAEWVVHGVQLPPSIGDVFRDHAVTGYDFAELVEDNGEALVQELGIERSSYRKKLVRSMRMMMSGVGVSPDAPQMPAAESKGCAAVRVRWGKSDGRGFPVHKYRLFRHSNSPTAVVVADRFSSSSSSSSPMASSSARSVNPAAAAAAAAATITSTPLSKSLLVASPPSPASPSSSVAIPPHSDSPPSSSPLLAPPLPSAGDEKKSDSLPLSELLSAQAAPMRSPQPGIGDHQILDSAASSTGTTAATATTTATRSSSTGSATTSSTTGGGVSEWRLVYEGADAEFVDGGELLAGQEYEYKVVAWNLFGHSEASFVSGSTATVDPATGRSCANTRRRFLFESSSFGLLRSHVTGSVDNGMASVGGSGGLGVVEAAWYLVSDVVWLLWWAACLFASWATPIATGLTTFLGLVMSLMRVRRAGILPGPFSPKRGGGGGGGQNHGQNRKPHEPDATDKWSHEPDATDKWYFEATRVVLSAMRKHVPFVFRLIPSSLHTDPLDPHLDAVGRDGRASPAAVGTAGVRNAQPPEMRNRSRTYSSGGGGRGGGGKSKGRQVQDPGVCYNCGAKLGGWSLPSVAVGSQRLRTRHTCGSCLSSFCASCGRTCHSWVISCPVGGGCTCAGCVKKEEAEERQRQLSQSPTHGPSPSSSPSLSSTSSSLFPPPPELAPLPPALNGGAVPFKKNKGQQQQQQQQCEQRENCTLFPDPLDDNKAQKPNDLSGLWGGSSCEGGKPSSLVGSFLLPPLGGRRRSLSDTRDVANGPSSSLAPSPPPPSAPTLSGASTRSLDSKALPSTSESQHKHKPPATSALNARDDQSAHGRGPTADDRDCASPPSSSSTSSGSSSSSSSSVRKKKAVERWAKVRRALHLSRRDKSSEKFSSPLSLFKRTRRPAHAVSSPAGSNTHAAEAAAEEEHKYEDEDAADPRSSL